MTAPNVNTQFDSKGFVRKGLTCICLTFGLVFRSRVRLPLRQSDLFLQDLIALVSVIVLGTGMIGVCLICQATPWMKRMAALSGICMVSSQVLDVTVHFESLASVPILGVESPLNNSLMAVLLWAGTFTAFLVFLFGLLESIRSQDALAKEKDRLNQVILERQLSERALVESELRYSSILETLEDAYFETDLEGNLTFCSTSLPNLSGYTVDELIGIGYRRLIPNRASKSLRIGFQRALREGENLKHFRTEMITKFGVRKDFIISGTALRNTEGNVVGFRGIARDFTENHRLEETLRILLEGTAPEVGESYFEALARYLGNVLEVNCAMVGELSGDGEKIQSLAFWDNGRFGSEIEYSLKGTPCERVIRNRRTCFFPRSVCDVFPEDDYLKAKNIESYLGIPLLDQSDEVLGILAILKDQPLDPGLDIVNLLSVFGTRAAAELARLRSEQARDRLEAQIQHTQKLESLGILAGGIAHDFKNLLVGVIGNVGLIQEELEPDSPFHESLDEIEGLARRASDLCNQLLAYAGKGKILVKKMDLSHLVQELVSLLEVSISKKAELICNFNPDLPLVEGDETQIRQVVMNLITNASEALEGESGTIHITTDQILLDQKDLSEMVITEGIQPAGFVRITVSDTGCGMDQETLSQLFDPFFTTKFTGRGLGMSAVLGIVRSHKGTLRLDSQLGKGTTIQVFFPAAGFPAEITTDSISSNDGVQSQGIVLVIDDERTVRSVAKKSLERDGMTVWTATNGADGLSILLREKDSISVVILDLTMPKMGGREVFERLSDAKIEVPVIFTSGYTEEDVGKTLSGIAEASFIQKPFSPNELRRKIHTVLSKKGQSPDTSPPSADLNGEQDQGVSRGIDRKEGN